MRRSVFCLILAALAAVPLAAKAAPSTDKLWQALTRTDVEAAYRLLKDNHPGAVAETGDRTFATALEMAHRRALGRAAAVTTYPGYLATLGEFAGAMGDAHIGSRALYEPAVIRWPGFVAAKRGDAWVVAKEDRNLAGTNLAGARIASCAGVPAEKWAREVLRFHTIAAVAALQVVHAQWLLLDDGNPFVTWPDACTFDVDGTRKTVPLRWTRIARDAFEKSYAVSAYGHAGFGFGRWRDGYWIAMEHLTPEAGPVVDAARKNEAALRAAPYVIVDLRGNGGGDDSYGLHLSEALYGRAHVDAVLGATDSDGGCHSIWRASAQNIAAAAETVEFFARHGDTDGEKAYRRAIKEMKTAMAAGRPLTGPAICHDKTETAPHTAPSKMKGRVIVITDSLCFSSCIGTMGYFHALGAVQVGVETGADTHYSEYRRIVLPSGLSTFSTLQAMMPDAPLHLGPYAPKPEFTFAGDIADTEAVKAWIVRIVLPATAQRR